jgi:hypothetical protein
LPAAASREEDEHKRMETKKRQAIRGFKKIVLSSAAYHQSFEQSSSL